MKVLRESWGIGLVVAWCIAHEAGMWLVCVSYARGDVARHATISRRIIIIPGTVAATRRADNGHVGGCRQGRFGDVPRALVSWPDPGSSARGQAPAGHDTERACHIDGTSLAVRPNMMADAPCGCLTKSLLVEIAA